MKSIIFPGGGSPDNHNYSRVYSLLESQARDFGYDAVDSSFRWPGHANRYGEVEGVITLDGAANVAKQEIAEYEKGGDEYVILGRSFGADVAVKCSVDMPHLNKLQKIVLWGPAPFWLYWKMYVDEFEKNVEKMRSIGCSVDQKFFETFVPIETVLESVAYKTVVATGELDESSSPAFLDYLHSLIPHHRRHLFDFEKPVKGAPHSVADDGKIASEIVSEYLR